MSVIQIETMHRGHWPDIENIYQMGIDTGLATFESKAPSMDVWDSKFLKKCRLIALCKKQVVGWAALQPVSTRSAYSGVAEETVYVHRDYQGQGIGGMLLAALISESEKEGFWTLTAVILEENKVSIHLHENFGFKIVGKRERIAFHQGKWTSTIIMERRSEVVGID